MGNQIDGNADVGRDFTGRDSTIGRDSTGRDSIGRDSTGTGNSTTIYLDRLRERQERAASDDEIDRLVYQLSDKLEDLARTVVDLRLEMVRLRIEINQLKEAEASKTHLKDWHVNLVLTAAIAITVMVAFSLYLALGGR